MATPDGRALPEDPILGKEHLRLLPSVDRLLATSWAAEIAGGSRERAARAIRSVLEALREEMLSLSDEGAAREAASDGELERRVRAEFDRLGRPSLRRTINATGILLHTGLGRAPLGAAARGGLEDVAGYGMLELDETTGKRGRRLTVVNGLLAELTGSEAAHVVNNNAAATLIALRTLAAGREVIVSRGQLVEIGGSYRMPDVMAESGCIMVEVGTTNRTRVEDYRDAVTENTALLLHVHCSNYRVVGFTETASVAELAALGREMELPVMDDIGSGCMVDLTRYGLPEEPTAQGSIADGADVVTFSTDKMLGGPQGGAIVGSAEIVEGIRRSPLARAMRVGKLTLSALERTLRLYLEPERLDESVPLYVMLSTPLKALEKRASGLARRLSKAAGRRPCRIPKRRRTPPP